MRLRSSLRKNPFKISTGLDFLFFGFFMTFHARIKITGLNIFSCTARKTIIMRSWVKSKKHVKPQKARKKQWNARYCEEFKDLNNNNHKNTEIKREKTQQLSIHFFDWLLALISFVVVRHAMLNWSSSVWSIFVFFVF